MGEEANPNNATVRLQQVQDIIKDQANTQQEIVTDGEELVHSSQLSISTKSQRRPKEKRKVNVLLSNQSPRMKQLIHPSYN